jgi:hypothetical protein
MLGEFDMKTNKFPGESLCVDIKFTNTHIENGHFVTYVGATV